jgi:hypothetical protein
MHIYILSMENRIIIIISLLILLFLIFYFYSQCFGFGSFEGYKDLNQMDVDQQLAGEYYSVYQGLHIKAVMQQIGSDIYQITFYGTFGLLLNPSQIIISKNAVLYSIYDRAIGYVINRSILKFDTHTLIPNIELVRSKCVPPVNLKQTDISGMWYPQNSERQTGLDLIERYPHIYDAMVYSPNGDFTMDLVVTNDKIYLVNEPYSLMLIGTVTAPDKISILYMDAAVVHYTKE